MNTLKQQIKTLAEEQVVLKNQRKTVNLVGERTVDPQEAAWRHSVNKINLRHMYLAKGLIKGLTVEQIEGKSKSKPDMTMVEKIISQNAEAVCVN